MFKREKRRLSFLSSPINGLTAIDDNQRQLLKICSVQKFDIPFFSAVHEAPFVQT
jgi:hypothetical protein